MRRKARWIFPLLHANLNLSWLSPLPMSTSPSLTLQTQTCASGSGVRTVMGSASLSLLPLPLFLWIPPLTSIFPSSLDPFLKSLLLSSSSLSHMPHHALCCLISTFKLLSSLSPFCIHGHCLDRALTISPWQHAWFSCLSSCIPSILHPGYKTNFIMLLSSLRTLILWGSNLNS